MLLQRRNARLGSCREARENSTLTSFFLDNYSARDYAFPGERALHLDLPAINRSFHLSANQGVPQVVHRELSCISRTVNLRQASKARKFQIDVRSGVGSIGCGGRREKAAVSFFFMFVYAMHGLDLRVVSALSMARNAVAEFQRWDQNATAHENTFRWMSNFLDTK